MSVFAAGAAWSVLMALRCQVHGDALNMLVRGWQLAMEGGWMPFGLGTSAGGFSPGGLTAVVSGLPLLAWADYRAVALATAAVHAGAFLWMMRAVGPALRPFGRWAVLVVLWLSPWRMAFSTHLWNSNFMLPIGMVHLATAVSMRTRPVAWATFVHVLAVALAVQLHTSFAVLAILSVLLWATGTVRVHWGAASAAIAVGVAALASFALSPTTVMFWQVFAVQHTSALAIALAVGPLVRTRAAAAARRAAVAWSLVAALLIVAVTFGAPMYRRGGRHALELEMRNDHPLFHELGLIRHGAVHVASDAPEAWWPIGLPADPEEEPPGHRSPP